ncbi:MFS transporter [Compostibacter hankyongensis]|uniref:MFS transporter n=1 Tax=Compostibacter hankyongensis TaxID=1007089 RepID=A0ABP8FFN2_9BACT
MRDNTSIPRLSGRSIWNMSAGFLGIQFGFALQNGNASRMLQTFGAGVEHLGLFWLAAPLAGMLVQPLIGHYSDRTWCRLGRRSPYFLGGALLTALALVLLPHADVLTVLLPPVLVGAGMLMIMDASINVAMEPFRSLVADKLPDEQRSRGFSVQTFLIGAGAVAGSCLPYVLGEYLGLSKTAAPGKVPQNVVWSFYTGALVLAVSILWTVVTTREYPPGRYAVPAKPSAGGIGAIWQDFLHMPPKMRQLGLVQFFSWFALFSLWVFATPAIAVRVYGTLPGDTASESYADAANWVGILFGIYNGVSALYALCLPAIARAAGRSAAHALSLTAGGIALISIYFIRDPLLLILPMAGVGLAWGSILSMPYAMLANTIPPHKMGVYMGIFNFFITFPQLVNGLLEGIIVRYVYHGQVIYALVLAGVFMILAALAVLRLKEG